MPICPICHSEIRDDFGLTTCDSCGASLFVEMDGSVVSSENPAVSDGDRSGAESYPDAPEGIGVVGELVAPIYEQVQVEPEPPGQDKSQVQLEENAYPAFDFDDPASSESEVEGGSGEEDSPFADVIEFANSDSPQTKSGLLTYRLLISGVDTAELRNALKEALTDRRFLWEADEIMRRIKNGALELENLPAVKALILVNRLSQYPLEIEWFQQALHQSD